MCTVDFVSPLDCWYRVQAVTPVDGLQSLRGWGEGVAQHEVLTGRYTLETTKRMIWGFLELSTHAHIITGVPVLHTSKTGCETWVRGGADA